MFIAASVDRLVHGK